MGKIWEFKNQYYHNAIDLSKVSSIKSNEEKSSYISYEGKFEELRDPFYYVEITLEGGPIIKLILLKSRLESLINDWKESKK